jgi:hypothetical protein
MPPWWALLLIGMNALTLFLVFALYVWAGDAGRVLGGVAKDVADLTGRS